jgi:hypothetical protein
VRWLLCCGVVLLGSAVLSITHLGPRSTSRRVLSVEQPAWPDQGSRPLRVAVCFFGLTRSLQFTINSIRDNVLDVLLASGAKYTIYLHTHNVQMVNNPRSREVNVSLDPSLYRLLRPDQAVVDEPIDWSQPKNEALLTTFLQHGDPWNEKGEHTSLKNVVNQLTSLRNLTAMWSAKFDDYDAVIYLRSDVWFFNRLNMSQLREAASITTHPAIWTPQFHPYGGLNDRFAFGNPAAMTLYGNRLDHAERFTQRSTLHAETFLQYAMKEGKVTCATTNIVFSRIRADGLVVDIPLATDDGGLNTTAMDRSFALRLKRSFYGTWGLQSASNATAPLECR